MDIGILNIGDELLAGKILNTNQFEIARLLTPLGHRIVYALVVGDDEAALGAAFAATLGPGSGPRIPAWPAVDILILTGGLGPTRDDLTRQAVAAYLGVDVEESPDALAWLSAFLGRGAADLPPGQRNQALVPAGAAPLRNPAGTACGFRVRVGATEVYAFPGVPMELEAMVTEHLLPDLAGDKVLLEKGLWTWGWSEGAQRQALEGLVLPPAFRFSSLPGEKGVRISLNVLAIPSERARCEEELDSAWRSLVAAIPPECLVDQGGLSLPEAVFALLKARGLTLSVAESCTGGGLGALLTSVPGSSSVFERGYLTYSNAAKTDLLGVPEEVLKTFGAVSEETVLAMAQGCLRRSGASHACAITGIAGPDGGTPEKPVGTVWIAVAGQASSVGAPVEAGGSNSTGDRQTFHARRFQFRGDRHAVRQRSTYAALNQIRLFLLGKAV